MRGGLRIWALAGAIALASIGCGDDDGGGGGGADSGAAQGAGQDAGPMCVDTGEACSFNPCCEGFCCCVAVGDGGSCGFVCVASRGTLTCR